ncbi:hypothetical protein [Mycetocola spongiae]|uniref:hypothetical protein n=1 Tax=Mycetocola spongiae TaxID=2859226 RepID=UPI001CF1830D|nr:hypothetical protein [Mycetocola spongiae]UCR87997.1 hypothetical protein KXZ72_08230 [Mycetocola spongiae]
MMEAALDPAAGEAAAARLAAICAAQWEDPPVEERALRSGVVSFTLGTCDSWLRESRARLWDELAEGLRGLRSGTGALVEADREVAGGMG